TASEKNVVRENAGGAGGTGAAATESRGLDGLAAVQLRVPLLYGVSLDIENYCTVSLFFEQAYL
ncbi:hypothetical protein, partial [Raoultella ornithinolytica]|uniref:hypothetical protein n=1 Tax=Raoultella ornithinolytica TaxID=54291 RepID=UPI001F3E95E3